MRHEQNSEPGFHELAHRLSKVELSADVQRVTGLIKKQCLWLMHQRPRNQCSLGFSRGHLRDRTIGEMRNAQPRQSFLGQCTMFRIGMMVWKNACAAEKAGKHHIAASGIRGTGSQQVRRYDSEQRAQFENIPSLPPQYGNVGPFPRDGIALSRNRLDQCRFAAAIWSQYAHVLPASDLQVDVMEGHAVTTHDRDMREGEQGRRDGVHSGLSGIGRFAATSSDDRVILAEYKCDARDQEVNK